MKYSQNEKILQITDQNLIVGVDIASQAHFARAFDVRGIELGKFIKFSNTAPGFAQLSAWLTQLKQVHGMDSVVVGMEPTGHYWFNLQQFLSANGIKVVLVNPFHVKRSKELDDNSPTKNDHKDPKTIAMLVRDGRYIIPYTPTGLYKELRTAMESRWRIVKDLVSISNRVKRWLSIYFPEFETVFASWEGKGALIVLKEFPTPAKVQALGQEAIAERWRKEKLRPLGAKRAARLVAVAKHSIGIREGTLSAETDLQLLLEDYEAKLRQLTKVMTLVEQLVNQIPGIEAVLAIKGMGLVTVGGIMAEIGDISRFEHSKQVIKLAGLNIKENSSGKHQGKTAISKRGRSRLRAILFQGIMPMIAKNEEFKTLHHYYTTRKTPLKRSNLWLPFAASWFG